MSGPWEDFKASSTEAGPWDEYAPKEDITEDTLFADRQRQIIPDLVKNVGGLIETGAGMLAGMPANIYGGIRGASSILAGEGVDTAVKRLEDARKSNFGFGEYKPVSKAGAEYTESIGKALNKPVEIAGDIGESLGGNEGRFVGELLTGSALELLDPLVPFAIAKGGMKKFSSKSTKPVETPKLDNIEKRLDAMVKRDPSNPATGPITDTRTGAQLSKEAYDAALREKELQRTSAFNRPDQFPDMVQESPIDRMVRDLGGEPNIPATPDSVMGRMADDLTTERSTPDQRAAQDLIEQRQAQLEQDMRIRATPELQAAERVRQEQAPAVSPEQAKYAEEQRMIAEARQAEATRIEQQQRALEQEQRDLDAAELMKFKRDQIQRDIDARQAQLEQDVRVQRLRDEEARIRSMLGERATPDQLRSQEMLAQANRPQVLPDPNNPVRGVDTTSPDIRKRLQEEEMFTNRPQTDEMVRERRKQESDRAAMEARLVEIEQELRDAAYRPVGNQQGPKTRAEQRKQKEIGKRGFANKQTGAFNPEVFTFGMRAVTKKLSALTDRLANDPTWMAGIRKAFNGTEPLKNRDGTPVVLLHGTTADIKGGVRGMAQGFHAGYGADSHFFVQNAGKGGSKAYLDPSNQRRNSQMYPVVIKGGNYPKLAADAGDWSPKEILNKNRDSARPIRDHIIDALHRTGYNTSEIDGFFRYVENQQGMAATNQAFSDVLKRAGIDGFFYTNKAESPKSGKLFNLFNRDDVPTRQKIVSQQAKHPESFVTWDNNNFKSVYEAPSTPNQSRMEKPIGQRGFANSQTGATDFFSFGKKDAKELIRDNNSKLNKIEQDLNNLSKSFWQDRSISSEDFRAQQADLLSQQRELEQVNRKWQQTLPPQRETEIHPGYKKIPLGAEVLTDRRGSLERATVRENRQSQFGDTTTWYPRVEFSDGQMKRLLPSDIKKVVRDPFKGPGKLQAGAIRLPFGKKPAVDQLKKIEGIKNDPQMRNIFPEKLSVEEIIKEHAALKTPDVDQNGLQRLMNHLTKGSLYQAIKTDNPIVRVVGEKIRQANNYAMEATGRLVHDGLAPLAQKLSKKEKADVWAVQQMAEAKGVTLTPEFLREEGFNQKQIDWVTEHKSVMDDMYSRMSDSMRAAGLEPVSARVAYVASRARGDFRRLIMKDNKVVGIMGDNTRMGLNKQIERLKKDHPEYEIGQERYYGGRAAKGTEEGFMQMLDFLSKDNPDFKLFVNHVNDMLSQDAFQYMNAKSHTMQKKRIEGMEGRKMFSDAVKNAEEGMQAQIRYAETMIKWSELSKAIAEVKPLLKQDNGLDMPNAKEWANEYIQGALGNSPGKLGDALDSVTAAIGKGTGIGTTIPARTVSAMKSYVNGVLLGFGNVGFLTANALQLPRTMPEMAAWLNTKGIEAGYDLGLGRALISVQKQLFNSKLTDLERGAFEYAKKNHVYSSNLFESGNTVSKGLSYYWQKGTQMIASPLERETRKVAFFAYTHMLDEAGFKPGDGLYEAAQNLTDMHMNNYAQAEAPRVYQETGGIGRSAYNLMSFKHNELSRLAMFAREIPNGQGKPILTAMASQVAFAGLIGTLGFAEADAMYEWLTAKMGEPTSLTKILLDNPEIPDALKFGMGSLADVDLTNRMGLQLTPGSMIDLVAPGFGKLGDIGGAVGEMVSQPNLYNAANVAREALPLSVGGIMDRTIFETEDGMALNRNKVSASAVRNDADKLWKALGMTGVNESVQKKLSYENQKIDQVYKDKRGKVIDGAIKEYYMRGVMPDNWVERYIELQGDPKEAKAAIQARIEALNVDRPTKELMQNAASKSISSQHKLLRRLGME